LKLLNTICYRLHGTPDDREAASSCGEAMKPVAFVSFSVNGFGLELWWVWWLAPVEIQFKAESVHIGCRYLCFQTVEHVGAESTTTCETNCVVKSVVIPSLSQANK